MSQTTAQVYEIPTIPSPRTISVTLGPTEYQITFRWMNAFSGNWAIDIADTSGNLIVSGVPLITGADLLAQYEYLGIGCALIVTTDGNPDAVPTFANLGTSGHLYFGVLA